MIDRSEASRLLGRAIAYEHQGNLDQARAAATELVTLLADVGVLPRRMPPPTPTAGGLSPERRAEISERSAKFGRAYGPAPRYRAYR